MQRRDGNFVFQFRAFISLLTGVSFVVMSVSGILLYIAPSGRRAAEMDWSVWALSRAQWTALHLSFSTLFVIASLAHVWLNRKPLLEYLTLKIRAARRLRWEWLAVVLLAALTAWGTLRPFEPFTTLLDQRDRFRRPESAKDNSPAETVGMRQVTLEAYCRQMNLAPEAVLENLRDYGISAEKSDTLSAIAQRNNIRPGPLRRLITSESP